MADYIWNDDGSELAWIEGDDVFSFATKQKVATRHGSQLFALDGRLLSFHLESAGLVRGEGDSSTPAAFLNLLKA